MKEIIEWIHWIDVKHQLPPDDWDVLLCDSNGYIQRGYRDEYGYYSEGFLKDKLQDITYWAYLPKTPYQKPVITNDEVINLMAKKRMLE